jgi:hypothetical protein
LLELVACSPPHVYRLPANVAPSTILPTMASCDRPNGRSCAVVAASKAAGRSALAHELQGDRSDAINRPRAGRVSGVTRASN